MSESKIDEVKNLEEGGLKCPQCNNLCERTEIDVEGLKVRGWKCAKCKYELLSPGALEKAYLILQAKKHEKVKISKRGNSYMITIPKAIADALDLANHSVAEVFLEDQDTISVKI